MWVEPAYIVPFELRALPGSLFSPSGTATSIDVAVEGVATDVTDRVSRVGVTDE